ncbi:hypothetical protein KR044_000181, partial [Drosophila immigrans]
TLEQNIHLNTELNTGLDIEDALDILMRNFKEAAAASCNRASGQHPWRRNTHHDIEMDEPTRRLLAYKQQRERILRTTRTPDSKRYDRAGQNSLKKALLKRKEENINKQFEGIDTHDRYMVQKLWKFTNKLKIQPQANYPLKIHQAAPDSGASRISWSKTTLEKAEVFAKHLEDRFQTTLHTSDIEITDIRDGLKQLLQQQLQLTNAEQHYIRPITLNELKLEIDELELRKSPGEDRIDNKLIKLLPLKTLLYIILIYNYILRIGHFPNK